MPPGADQPANGVIRARATVTLDARALDELGPATIDRLADLVADRLANGLETQGELKQAQSAVPASRAELAANAEQIALTGNRIAALIGAGPDRARTLTRPAVTALPADLPADAGIALAGRRPDLLAARARVEAALRRRVVVHGAAPFRLDQAPPRPPALVVGSATQPRSGLVEAIQILAAAATDLMRQSRRLPLPGLYALARR